MYVSQILIFKFIFFHKNGSISISSAEAGMLRSKAVKTSGCSTPSLPTTPPLT